MRESVRVEICMEFDALGDGDSEMLRDLALALTNRRSSVTVAEWPNGLVCELTMTAQPQYLAVETIDDAIRFEMKNTGDYTIRFPRTPAEIASAKRKAERRATS